MKLKKLLLFLFVLQCAPFSVFSAGRTGQTVQFHNINEEFGISIRETNSVCSDSNGFIWVASKMGMIRYSKSDIRTYKLPYESADVISVYVTFGSNTLYGCTNNGQIFRYDPIQDQFNFLLNISKLLRNPYFSASGVQIDDQGRLWVSSTSGMFCYDDEEGLRSLEPNRYIYSMSRYDKDRFILAVNGELILFNPTTEAYGTYYTLPKDEVGTVTEIHIDRENNQLWLGTMANGLFVLEQGGDKPLFRLKEVPSQPILAIENYTDSSLLVGIDGQGIWEVNTDNRQIVSVMKEDSDNPGSLKGNGVYDIFSDHNRRVWVCTYSGGVSYFDKASRIVEKLSHTVNNSNSLVNDDVNAILEDREGNFWFATNNGISKWERRDNRWTAYFHNKQEHAQVFLSLCEDQYGNVWAGSYSSGVYVLNRKTGRVVHHYSSEDTEGEFSSNFIFNIYRDKQNDIWIGGVKGSLVRYKNQTKTFQSYEEIYVSVMCDYKVDQLLIGSSTGIMLLDKKSGDVQNLLEGYLVLDFYLKGDVLWICTSGSGVLRYNMADQSLKQFTVDAGLPSNFVTSIVYVDGYFWIGTEQGICRLDEDQSMILTFNSLNDLNRVSFNRNAHCTANNGNLMWGTNQGALIFDPEVIKSQKSEGQIFIQEMIVDGRSIRESSRIQLDTPIDSLQSLTLRYFQNNLSVEMVPIQTTIADCKFSWKLEGLGQDWSKPSANRILSYSNLPSGDFVLRLRMYDGSLSHVLAERAIQLRVIPPVWERTWFRISVFTFIVGLVIFLIAFYIDRLKKRHSEEKIRFFANTAHDIRTSLTLIRGPIEELNKESGLTNKGLQYLHLATEQTHRLSRVVTQLMDFQKVDVGKERLSLRMVDIVKMIESRTMMFESYAKTKNIELKFRSNFPGFVTAVDEVMLEKVIDNLISNAIKYSYPDVPVSINFQVASNKWFLEVKDQGIGISKKAQRQLFHEYYRGENAVNSKIVGSGIGLLLVKNYVSLHGGKISCDSQENVGSTFQLSMPVKTITDTPEAAPKTDTVAFQMPDKSNAAPNTVLLGEVKSKTKPKVRILVAEDHEYLREFLKSAMDDEFQVELAEDGEQAWQLIQKTAPDLIVSDIMMPKMDGFELCEKLKSNYETSHIPIILLTALSNRTEQLKGLGLGADDYLTKPFDVSLLQQRIKTLIQNREIIRDKALKIIKHSDDNEVILDNELNDKFLKRMGEVVRENMANSEFSKDDFAAAMNVSPSLLYKKIKALTNQSPTDFIKSIRLDHSLDLIQSRKYSVTEVSELCGFSSVGYFSTVFRKHYGKSPTQVN